MELDIQKHEMIDANRLQYEWQFQVQLVRLYSNAIAETKLAMDDAERDMNREKAKAYKRASEKIKSPVDAIKAEAELDEDYQRCLKAFNNARYDFAIAQANMKTIDNRKTALEEIDWLFGKEYWGTPYEKKEYNEWRGKRVQEREEENHSIAEKTAMEAQKRSGKTS